MNFTTLSGYYGSGATKTDIFCAETRGGWWYVCDGGQTVNFTHDYMYNGVNVEHLNDVDCFTVSKPITSIEELQNSLND